MPSWTDDAAGGVMIRGGLWLLQVIGEGNTFTKEQVRQAFPGISQADRRIRDLRNYHWVIYSNTEDATLFQEEQRFVKAGVPVWDKAARRANAPEKAISAKQRQAIFDRDGHMCTLCGISAGEPYPDDAVTTAVIGVSRRGGHLFTECKRCRSGEALDPLNVDEAVAAAHELEPGEILRLLRWMERGRRGTTELDRAWAAFLRVPTDQRQIVRERIQETL